MLQRPGVDLAVNRNNDGRVVVVGCRGLSEVTPRQRMGTEADVRGLTLFGAVGEEVETDRRGADPPA